MAGNGVESNAPEVLDQPEIVPATETLKFVCVYRTGGDYNADYVRRLAVSVNRHLRIPHEFICLSDDPEVAHVGSNMPLKHNWPGWWSLMEIYRLRGPVIFTGLDTVIVGDITPLGEYITAQGPIHFMATRGWRTGELSSQVLAWNGDYQTIYHEFCSHLSHGATFTGTRLKTSIGVSIPGDQQFLQMIGLTPHSYVQDVFPHVCSYKHHARNSLPKDARIVCFHGHPRPHELHPKPGWME